MEAEPSRPVLRSRLPRWLRITAPRPEPGRRRPRSLREWRSLVEILLLPSALVWGAWEFHYRERIAPNRLPALLNVTPSVERLGRRDSLVLVRAGFQLKNPSEGRIYAPAMWYTAIGHRLLPRNPEDTTYLRMLRESAGDFATIPRYSRVERSEVVAAGHVLPPMEGVWFDPGEEQALQELFYVPECRYDYLEIRLDFMLARDMGRMAPLVWLADSVGGLSAEVRLKGSGYDRDTTRVEALDEAKPEHADWASRTGFGWSWVVSTLPLLGEEGGGAGGGRCR